MIEVVGKRAMEGRTGWKWEIMEGRRRERLKRQGDKSGKHEEKDKSRWKRDKRCEVRQRR